MKNLTRKIVCALMAVTMVFVLFGCGKSGADDTEKFIGTWNAKIDMTDLFNENFQQGMGESGDDLSGYFNIDKFELTMVFTFKEDGTYSMTVDKAGLNKTVDDLKDDLKDGLTTYFEDMIAENELGMSLDEVLGYLEISMDELIDASLGSDMIDGLVEAFEAHGKWKAEKGKLYTSESVNDDIDESGYELYEFTSGGIKLSEPEGVKDDLGVFPMLLTKVN